jgi:hypothetical protein
MPFLTAFELAAPEMLAAETFAFAPEALYGGMEFGTPALFEGLGAEALGAGAGLFGEFGGSLAGQALGGAPSIGEAVTSGITSGGAGAGGAGINEALVAQQQANAAQVANSGMSPLTQAGNVSAQPVTNTVVNTMTPERVAQMDAELTRMGAQDGIEQVAQELIKNQGIGEVAPGIEAGSAINKPYVMQNPSLGNTPVPGGAGLPSAMTGTPPPASPFDALSSGFQKAIDYVKENPFSAASMGYSAMKLLGDNKKQEAQSSEYNGPLSRYKMSPNFQGRQANPQDFQYTPQQYNYAEGGIASFRAGGDPSNAALDYYKSMQRQQANPPSGKGDPGAHYAGDVFYDQDPDTKYLDPVSAAQVRMAKINKRSNVQVPNMKRPTPMGQLNLTPLGIKAGAAASSLDPETMAAQGGIMHSSLGSYAAGGNPRLLKGPGDGMSDNIPATIAGKQPARLANGEFVIPADVVSHLGNGSTDAGAKVLHEMMNKVRQARTGNSKQGKQINAHKFVPT